MIKDLHFQWGAIIHLVAVLIPNVRCLVLFWKKIDCLNSKQAAFCPGPVLTPSGERGSLLVSYKFDLNKPDSGLVHQHKTSSGVSVFSNPGLKRQPKLKLFFTKFLQNFLPFQERKLSKASRNRKKPQKLEEFFSNVRIKVSKVDNLMLFCFLRAAIQTKFPFFFVGMDDFTDSTSHIQHI